MKPNKIVVCSTCLGNEAAAPHTLNDTLKKTLQDALLHASLDAEFAVDTVECLGACQEPQAIALQGKDRATFVFAGIDPSVDVDDIMATCKTYLSAPQGWIEDARPCGRLRDQLRSRVPAFVQKSKR